MHIVSKKPSEPIAQRFGRLAKLPVFLDLANKQALVAGGSAAAAWKAELLAAAGANVHIYAPQISPEMQAFLEYGVIVGTLTHHAKNWTDTALGDSAIAIADAEDEDEARRFSEATKARGIVCNVIDRPRYSTIQFGAIVNRSPVVVAISTDGAAPVLGQAIRRRIETLLPSALAEWAAFAQTIRERVKCQLPTGQRRRHFWECFSDLAFGFASDGLARRSAEELLDSHVKRAQENSTMNGRITFVDVTTDEADLLTLRALRAMQMADVIVFDDLVPSQVLELTRREARHMLVRQYTEVDHAQIDSIDDIAMKFMMAGKHVVVLRSTRLASVRKADAEMIVVECKGIPVEIVASATRAAVAPAPRVHARTATVVV
nr:NAD(P)-dependent oxidoreductase [uncultured Dongia sp.]